MSDETYGAEPIVLQYVEDALELLEKAAEAAEESQSKGVRDKITCMLWDATDALSPVVDELFMIEDEENE